MLLIHDKKQYNDHLFQSLKQTLKEKSIPFVSTHNIAPVTNSKNFIADGHFTKKNDKFIAQEVMEIINKNLNR